MNEIKRPGNWKRRVLVFALLMTGLLTILITIIPTATAPVWYGSGNYSGLVGRWSCEGNFLDSSGQGMRV